MENPHLSPPPFLELPISSAALRALVKTEGLDSRDSSDVMRLMLALQRNSLGKCLGVAQALQTGESFNPISVEGLDSSSISNVMNLLLIEERDFLLKQLQEAMKTGECLRLIQPNEKDDQVVSPKKPDGKNSGNQFEPYCRIQIGETLIGYIGKDYYEGFCLVT